ncbi:hypothetical protein NG821_01885 [Prevotella cerevisiae]|uniref:Uncharacterized protein n=1 Tax=Segatella cerevisiae TaxID=2053716 RepID=A0ABT1BWH4_9BACT|nr:hypothetical protein [Segatella cerevisiae]MCO6024603.1 hypothetical protein [Segatella cerevisiae]
MIKFHLIKSSHYNNVVIRGLGRYSLIGLNCLMLPWWASGSSGQCRLGAKTFDLPGSGPLLKDCCLGKDTPINLILSSFV